LFAANAAAMRALVEDLRSKIAAIETGGTEEARRRLPDVANRCRASGCGHCSTRACPFSNSRSSPPMECMTVRFLAAGIITGIGRIMGRE